MKADYTRYIIFFSVMLLGIWILSCSGRPGERVKAEVPLVSASPEAPADKPFKMIMPLENAAFKLHNPVKLVLEIPDSKRMPDSVSINYNGKTVTTLLSQPWEFSIPATLNVTTGRKSVKATAYKDGRQQHSIARFIIIFSDIVPKSNGYRVVNTYPHDRQAFTQGLVYDNGRFFESTGQESRSTLREVEIETGKVIREHNLDASLFGEGITLYNDSIYHVTWTTKVGFIYEKSTFKVLNKIYYPTQGWGLTTIDDRIVMSDGTEIIYFYDPETFTVASSIQVYDNEKKIDSLNELEYINGEIWANIWMSDRIARIDPLSGKIIAYIDLAGILPESVRNAETDVLNGIAYDPAGKRIFITGKKWPKLYEIKITE